MSPMERPHAHVKMAFDSGEKEWIVAYDALN